MWFTKQLQPDGRLGLRGRGPAVIEKEKAVVDAGTLGVMSAALARYLRIAFEPARVLLEEMLTNGIDGHQVVILPDLLESPTVRLDTLGRPMRARYGKPLLFDDNPGILSFVSDGSGWVDLDGIVRQPTVDDLRSAVVQWPDLRPDRKWVDVTGFPLDRAQGQVDLVLQDYAERRRRLAAGTGDQIRLEVKMTTAGLPVIDVKGGRLHGTTIVHPDLDRPVDERAVRSVGNAAAMLMADLKEFGFEDALDLLGSMLGDQVDGHQVMLDVPTVALPPSVRNEIPGREKVSADLPGITSVDRDGRPIPLMREYHLSEAQLADRRAEQDRIGALERARVDRAGARLRAAESPLAGTDEVVPPAPQVRPFRLPDGTPNEEVRRRIAPQPESPTTPSPTSGARHARRTQAPAHRTTSVPGAPHRPDDADAGLPLAPAAPCADDRVDGHGARRAMVAPEPDGVVPDLDRDPLADIDSRGLDEGPTTHRTQPRDPGDGPGDGTLLPGP